MLPIKKVKVLVVDDSLLFRETLVRELSTDKHIEIVGVAVDTIDALEKIKSLHPDVVTLDIEMPRGNGIDFLKKLLPKNPLPVVVVSSLPINTFEALDAGAVDFVKKPQVSTPYDLNNFIRELLIKIKIASSARIGKKPMVSISSLSKLNTISKNTIIAIGASTGGTEAILSVVKELPATTPPIVIVQHMPPVFTNMYAQRVDKLSKMRVTEAKHLDRLETGKIIIAAGDKQMTVCKDTRGFYIKSQPGEKVSGHCPSVDVLFSSVAAVAGANSIGVILTGMGADGAKGLLKMKKAGAYTIGQNKDSCVVYGMPMVAYNIGGVIKQLPLENIAAELINALNKTN